MTCKITILAILLATSTFARAAVQTYQRDYTYQAGEDDSKNTAREKALVELRKMLLREVGEHLIAYRTAVNGEYAEKVKSVTAGVVGVKVLDESWNGSQYYIKAEMTVDSAEVERKIKEILNSRQKKRDREAEVDRGRKEAVTCNETGNSYYKQKNFSEAMRWYQMAIDIDPSYADAYISMGNAYDDSVGNFTKKVDYYRKAARLGSSRAQKWLRDNKYSW